MRSEGAKSCSSEERFCEEMGIRKKGMRQRMLGEQGARMMGGFMGQDWNFLEGRGDEIGRAHV